MSKDIKVTGALVFPENVPTRAGEVVNSIGEIYDIPAPRVGMTVYDKSTGINYIVRSLKAKVIDGVQVDNAQVDMYEEYDVNEAKKKLIDHIQGTSQDSDAVKDPFKLITLSNGYNFSDLDDLIEILDSMHEKTAAEGKKYMGAFRAILSSGVVTIYNTPLSVGDDVWMQTITGCFRFNDDGELIKGYNNYGMFYRKLENSEWSSWKIANENIIKEWISNISNEVVDEEVRQVRIELEKRIQGTSDDTSAWGDPFKKLKDFDTLQELDEYLKGWHGETADGTKGFDGKFRTKVKGKTIEIFSNVLGYGDKTSDSGYEGDSSVWIQEIKGAVAIDKGAYNHLGDDAIRGWTDTGYTIEYKNDKNETAYHTWYSRSYKQALRSVSAVDVIGIHTLRRVYNGYLGGWSEWVDVTNPYITSPLYGKNVLILGGSFAHNMKAYNTGKTDEEGKPVIDGDTNSGYGFTVDGRRYAFQNYIAKELGLKRFDNFAVQGNGVCIANNKFKFNIYTQLENAIVCADERGYKYDAIILAGGINDYQAHSPLGSLTDLAGDNTFYASYKKIINKARTYNSDIKLFMTTPFKAFHILECWKSTEQTVNKAGHRYYEYLQALKDIAQYASIPLLDIWAIQQVDSNNYRRYYRIEAGDATHPNGKGYQAIAPAMLEFLAWGKGMETFDHNAVIEGLNILGGATKVTWNSSSNMNNFKTPGVYDIYGERTRQDDNLPILNASSGHSIAARLTVVASTLQPANNEICITQFLQLSNRVGGDGASYVRTYNENNNGMNGWSPWQKQMGMVETLINSNDTTVGQEVFSGSATKIGNGLNGMVDNGMYSGIYIDNLSYTGNGSLYYLSAQPTFVETFVLVVINDYAATGKLNLPRHITQLKYAVDAITGQSTVQKRVGTGNDAISWGDWSDIGGGGSNEIELSISTIDAAVAQGYKIKNLISQGLIKENITYVLNVPNSYWFSIKTFFSSKSISNYFEGGKNGSTEGELKIIYRNHYNDPVLWIEGYSAEGDYYIISIKNPHEDTEVIKISTPMTVLE